MNSQIMGLLVCFLVYVLFIFIFACVYYHLMFRRGPRHFIFQREIRLGRKEEIEDLIRDLEPGVEVLEHVVGELAQGKDVEELTAAKTAVDLKSGRKYRISQQTTADVNYMGMVTAEYRVTYVSIWNSCDNVVGSFCFEDAGYNSLKECLGRFENKLTRYKQQLEAFADTAPNMWSYWDFCYFSASTQTTLGYGDILPNSTPARTVVILQVFLGLAILVLAINFVIMLFAP